MERIKKNLLENLNSSFNQTFVPLTLEKKKRKVKGSRLQKIMFQCSLRGLLSSNDIQIFFYSLSTKWGNNTGQFSVN